MDNCLLLYQLTFQEFCLSFWEGKTLRLHKLLDRELLMSRKIEMMFRVYFLHQSIITLKNFVGLHGALFTHLRAVSSSEYHRDSCSSTSTAS